jgi:hypothetical protein
MNSTASDAAALKQSLVSLHAQLSQAQNLDDASRQLLHTLLVDIEGVLQQGDAPSLAAAPTLGAAPHRLEAAAVDFEAGHPALAASVRQFIDLLGRVGL